MTAPRSPDDPKRQLASLLKFGRTTVSAWSPHDLKEMLSHQLTLPLAEEFGVPVLPQGPSTFGELIRCPNPSVALLRALKDYARHSGEASDLPQEVVVVLYIAAIVLARQHHNERISSLSDGEILARVRWVLACEWVDADTRAIVSHAATGLSE